MAAAFVAIGAAGLIAYAVFWLEPLWLGDFRPFAAGAVALGAILGPDWAGLAWYLPAFLIPLALYFSALLLLPLVPRRVAWSTAIVVAAAAPLVLLYTYPAMAADVFDYLMSGRLLSEYGLNPYTNIANQVPDDPYYAPVAWKHQPSIYGPAWVLAMGALTEIGGDSPVAALLMTKGLAIVAHWTAAGLVYLVAARLAPGRALFAFVAYAWNPLPVLYFAIDGHNDAVLLVLMLGALYLGLGRRWELALPALTLAALVKFVPAALIPLFIWQARTDRSRLTLGLAASVALVLVLYAPLWAGSATFDGVRDQGSRMTSSFAALASYALPDSWLRPIAVLLFVGGYGLILRRGLPLVTAAYAVLFLYLMVLSFWTKEWYFTWLVALGAIAGGRAFLVVAPGVLGAFSASIFGAWGWSMDWFGWQERWGMKAMELWLTSCVLGGWLAGAAVLWAEQWLRRPGDRPAAPSRVAQRPTP